MFALTMAKCGHLDRAVAALVSFDCLLRVGEMTRIVYSDVVRANDPRLGSAHPTMAIRLPRTKTGLNQWVSMHNPVVASILHAYLLRRSFGRHDRVFPFSAGQFNRSLHSVAAALKVDHIPYVAHSFRHGGATCAYLSGSTIEQIVHRGRWRRLESARRYIQAGPALMASWTIPERLNRQAQAILPELLTVMEHLFDTMPQEPRQPRRVRFTRA
jgi:integrase